MTYKDEQVVASLRDKRLHHSDWLVLTRLAAKATSDGTTDRSAVLLAKELRLSYRQVLRCLDKLASLGYITEVGTTGLRGRVRIWLLADCARATRCKVTP